jgi:hypothetical protein
MTAATRRDVLIGSGVVGGALMVPVALGAGRSRAATAPTLAGNTWLGVDSQGRVTLALPKTEMGQGILTTITMIAAEELAERSQSFDPRRRFGALCADRPGHRRFDLGARRVATATRSRREGAGRAGERGGQTMGRGARRMRRA